MEKLYRLSSTAILSRWEASLISIWRWPSAPTALMLTQTRSLTNARKSAAQLTHSSATLSGVNLILLYLIELKKGLCLYGEKQLRASPLATALILIVRSAVKVGTTTSLMTKNIAASAMASISLKICVPKKISKYKTSTCV